MPQSLLMVAATPSEAVHATAQPCSILKGQRRCISASAISYKAKSMQMKYDSPEPDIRKIRAGRHFYRTKLLKGHESMPILL